MKAHITNELKSFLIISIEDILRVLRQYHLYGSDALVKVVKAQMADFLIKEHKLDKKDKKNPLYQKFQSVSMSLLVFMTPSLWDVAGVTPAIIDWWKPRIEKKLNIESFLTLQKKGLNVIEKTDSISTDFTELSTLFEDRDPWMIEGKELKALPPSQDEQNIMEDESENAE